MGLNSLPTLVISYFADLPEPLATILPSFARDVTIRWTVVLGKPAPNSSASSERLLGEFEREVRISDSFSRRADIFVPKHDVFRSILSRNGTISTWFWNNRNNSKYWGEIFLEPQMQENCLGVRC